MTDYATTDAIIAAVREWQDARSLIIGEIERDGPRFEALMVRYSAAIYAIRALNLPPAEETP